MKAKEILNKFIKKEMVDKVGVIAISQTSEMHWYHIHNDEQVPEKGYSIAIHVRRKKNE